MHVSFASFGFGGRSPRSPRGVVKQTSARSADGTNPKDSSSPPGSVRGTPSHTSARSGGSDGATARSGWRSLFSTASSSVSRWRPTRHDVLRQIKEPEETGGFARLRSVILKPADENPEDFREIEEESEDDETKDIVEELCLSVEPHVEELGETYILELKRAGKLDVEDHDLVQRFKKHKASQSKTMFEAENANNIGCEYFKFGDITSALAYFKRAFENASKEVKPAAKELADFKQFIRSKFEGSLQSFYRALAEDEWRLALGRKRFVDVMAKLSYGGDSDRLFSMLDFYSRDGKATITEIDALLATRGRSLSRMDDETVHKGAVVNNLGACFLQQGKFTVGLAQLRESLKIVQRASELEEEDPLAQRVTSNISIAYVYLGDFDAALNYSSRVMARAESVGGPFCDEVMSALFVSGYCFLVKANRFEITYDHKRMDKRRMENPIDVNYALAQCAFKDRLRRQLKKLSDLREDPDSSKKEINSGFIEQLSLDIAQSHEIVAEIHDKQRELERGLEHIRKACQYKEEILSDSDPELLSAWNVLASVYMRLGRFQEALSAMEKAVNATTTLFGNSHLTLANELLHVGLILFRLAASQAIENRDEANVTFGIAVEKLVEAREMQVDVIGEEDAEVAATIQLQGSVYMAQGNWQDARRCFERALLIRIAVFGRGGIATASSAHALGSLYARVPRRQEEALTLLRKAATIRERLLGPDSVYLADSLHELGSVFLRRPTRKEHETALFYLSKAALVRERTCGKESLQYAASMHQLGQAHAHLGLYLESRFYLQVAFALRERFTPKKGAQLAMTRFALGATLVEIGDLRSAMRMIRASYAAREHLHGPDHAHCADCLHQIGVVHYKGGKLEAALPFLLRALDVRTLLNDMDVKSRQEDSDEDPKELVTRKTTRDIRIKRVRRQQRQERSRDERRRRTEDRRTAEQIKRHTQDAEKTTRASGSLIGTVFSVMGSLRKGSAWARSETPRSEGSEERDSSAIDDSPTSGASPRGGASNRSTGKDRESQSEHSDDSNVCLKDIGIDIRGYLAGAIGASMLAIGVVYMDLSKNIESKKHLRNAMCILEEACGLQSSANAEALHTYGVFNQRVGQFVVALRYFKQALQIREQCCGHLHMKTAASNTSMGEVLVALGQRDEADINFGTAVKILEELYGQDDDRTKTLSRQRAELLAEGVYHDDGHKAGIQPKFAVSIPETFWEKTVQEPTTEGVAGSAIRTESRTKLV